MEVLPVDAGIAIAGLPAIIAEGTTVNLSANVTSDPSGTYYYSWRLEEIGAVYTFREGKDVSFILTGYDSYPAVWVNVYRDEARTDLLGSLMAGVTVVDLPPSATLTGTAVAVAGIGYTLNLNTLDAGSTDTLSTWIVNWGDGTVDTIAPSDPYAWPPESCPVTATHTYAGGRAEYAVTAVATVGGVTVHAEDLTVLVNPAPVVAAVESVLNINEGTTAVNIGTYSDECPGVVLRASIGSVVGNLDGTWSWTYEATAIEARTVTITATDSDGAVSSVDFDLNVTADAVSTNRVYLIEGDSPQTTGGTLVSGAAFAAMTAVPGTGGYGAFSIDTSGVWTYVMNSAHDEFIGGTIYTDTITVAAADSSMQTITVTTIGTNDFAVIAGSATGSIIETDAVQSVSGTLSATDVDSSTAFMTQTNVAGTNGYGTFSMAANGAWSYTMSSAHDEFIAGQSYTDSITVATADGTAQVLTVTMTGTNDAAMITGSAAGTITEGNSPQTVTGTLSATDVDSSAAFVARTDVAGTNGYGRFTIDASGGWSYTMGSAHDEFVVDQSYTDAITVATADGTARVITVTMTGTDDGTVITGTATGSITESNVVQNVSGTLTATDPDGTAAFVARTEVAGSNGYGKFSIDSAGVWTYTMNSAHDEFVKDRTYTDAVTVSSVDGTASHVITITMTGTDDGTVISGTAMGSITESNVVQRVSGTLTASDSDSSAAFVARTNVAGSSGYGKFSIYSAGLWTYTMTSAHNEFVKDRTYTDTITVSTVDGTTQVIAVTMTGTDDGTVITGTATGSITESNAVQSVSGILTATDPDSSAAFVARTDVAGTSGYGRFTIDGAGAWTYTMDSAHDEFVKDQTYTDTITVATVDGTTQVITVTMTGTDDGTVITGTATGTITESNVIQSVSGTLTATDPDSSAAFVAQADVAGANGYGRFTIDAAGGWTYTMNNAHDEFVKDQTYADTITVATVDGTTQVITVTMTGTDDGTVITGTATGSITESNVIQSVSGILAATDPDSSAAFVTRTDALGTGGYGRFTIDAAGVWTYTMNSAHDEFVKDQTYTDTITVSSVDGTTQVIAVTLTGTDDATVIMGTATGAITESNAVQSVSGTLTATDPDSSAAFVARTDALGTGGYGRFTIDAAGVWTYTMNSAHDEFVKDQTYTDAITVAVADGTTQVITVTMTGTDDGTVITGTATGSITESNAVQSVSGTLTATDPDSTAAFVARTDALGTGGYGRFTIDAVGTWTYTMDSAHNEFVKDQTYTDAITVATVDGTTQVIAVTMTGTDDGTVITGTATGSMTESNVVQSVSGTLAATDPDSSAAFVARTDIAGSNGYGRFTIDAAGAWTYTMNSAHDEFVKDQTYTDAITVATVDGTTHVITVTMTGADDGTVITGTATGSITESNAVQSVSGTLTAADPDGSAAFVARTNVVGGNGYGNFTIDAAGAWTYTMNSAHNEFVKDQTYTDTITVAVADGTTQVITVTMTGTDDGTVITGTATGSITESNVVQSVSGTLTATDPDSFAAFVARTDIAGSNGYGRFTIDGAGAWTYTMNSAHNEFVKDQTYTDAITVAVADGATQVITVTLTGTDDGTVITGTATGSITESNVIQSVSGTLTAADPDSTAAFMARTDALGTGGYGRFTIDAAGAWTYTMDSAHNEFVKDQTYTDTITVSTVDGTTQVIAVTMTGTDDGTVIAGTATGSITESNVIQSVSGTLTAADPDSTAAFMARTDALGTGGYGRFTIDAAGAWTYTMDSAHNEFVKDQTYTDTITVSTVDGTTQVIAVTMTGTDDGTVIAGTATGSITESDVVQSVSGTLTAADPDSTAAFVARTDALGTGGYGTFTIEAAGAWTYTMNSVHNEFVKDRTYTDAITVATADGTTQVITVTMTGTDDGTVITGTATGSITESNVVQSVSGTLTATDPDSTAAFVARTDALGTGGYGRFTIDAAGVWTYTMNSAHDEFVKDQTYTDTITVSSLNGTASQVITVTMTGTNDAAVITGTSAATTVTVTEGENATVSGSFSDAESESVRLSASIGTVTTNTDGTWKWNLATSGSTANQQVTITATDSNGASGDVRFNLTVNNAVPSVMVDRATVTVNKGETATNSGRFSDAGNDAVRLTASIGTVTANADGTWDWKLAPGSSTANQQVTITATDSDGRTASVGFTLTRVNAIPTGAVVVVGNPILDQIQIAETSTIGDADGLGAFSYQWLRNGVDIPGATGDWYKTTAADVGSQVSVTVSYADGGGTLEFLSSAYVDIWHSGRVLDGYLANALVWVDYNDNALLDWTDANGNGLWNAGEGESWTLSDTSGQFNGLVGMGNLMLAANPADPESTIDISTGKPFIGSFSAPCGSAVINPLTTLLTAAMASGSTEAELKTALGIAPTVDLTTFDPFIAAATAADADAARLALQVQGIATQITNLIHITASATGSSATAKISSSIANTLVGDLSLPHGLHQSDG